MKMIWKRLEKRQCVQDYVISSAHHTICLGRVVELI